MTILCGDCLEVMKTFPDNHFSAIVTDPPYGLHFMGKDWDKYAKGKRLVGRCIPKAKSNSEAHDVARYDESRNDEFEGFMCQVALEALRITKPGGHCLMFGAPRRYHRQTCALEDAGWEIRDCLMWIFGSGFPKSHNHFGVEGYGTALKPAYEPIIMAMKPLDGTFKENAEKWGQAGINIDGCRIGEEVLPAQTRGVSKIGTFEDAQGNVTPERKGRWPANVIFDEEAAKMLDEQSGESKSRFFYCAKASSRERNEGLEGLPENPIRHDDRRPGSHDIFNTEGCGRNTDNKPQKNNHPTVKPLALMRYLIKLVAPPTNALILDPFAGSGSTVLAAKQLGIEAVGIEMQSEYVTIAQARLDALKEPPQRDLFGDY